MYALGHLWGKIREPLIQHCDLLTTAVCHPRTVYVENHLGARMAHLTGNEAGVRAS